MSDAEDTKLVPTTLEATRPTVLANDIAPLENVSINELPEKTANPSPEQITSFPNASSKDKDIRTPANSKKNGEGTAKKDQKQRNELNKTEGKKLQPCPPPQSRCKVRSRDTRQCKKHFREMIGKHEIRNDELEQHETDLRQRLEVLECSMPAVMVWNIWRMAQGSPVSHLRDIVEKQFLDPTAGFSTCPSTPSQHWDCRVREVEAERKQAKHRAEEARQVFAVKGDALKIQKQQIEEAKKVQEERKTQIAKLEEEVKRLQDALSKAQGDENSCETGECGEIRCRQMWLQGVSSVSSIHSTDLECLARLQDLAEAELCMKRQIVDLERRECAYMRTLQQADEMWAKMEDDNASNMGDLKEQLHAKISANQKLADRIVELEDEIEKLRSQITKALAALDEYRSKTFVEVGLGDLNVSTEEKIEQTEDETGNITVTEVKATDTNIIEESRTEDIKLVKKGVTESGEIKQLGKDEIPEYTPFEQSDQTQLKEQSTDYKTLSIGEIKGEIEDSTTANKQPDDEQIQGTIEMSTMEESVQAKPEFEHVETQSMTRKFGQKEETTTEEPTHVQITTSTVAIGGEKMSAVAEISPKVPVRYSADQQRGISALRESTKTEVQQVDKPASVVDGSRSFKDKGSLVHLLQAPTKDENTGLSVPAKTEKNFGNQTEAFHAAPQPAAEETSRADTQPASKEAETPMKTTPGPVEEIVPKPISRQVLEPVAKVLLEADSGPVIAAKIVASSTPTPDFPAKPTSGPVEEIVPKPIGGPVLEPVAKVLLEADSGPVIAATIVASSTPTPDYPAKPFIQASAKTPAELSMKSSPHVISEDPPTVLPLPTTAATPEQAAEPVTEEGRNPAAISPPEPAVEPVDKPILNPAPEVVERVNINLAAKILIVPVETLVSWHNSTACVRQQVSHCPRCSSTSGEILQMLNEIRTYLGKDAPDLAKIECTKVGEGVENFISHPNKKGPCICKPKTCPLDGTPTTAPLQASVQLQTAVDEQSQTSMPARIPSRETRGSKSGKGSIKSKEEVKLTSIEEGTEPDLGTRWAKSIPETKDESTVTVGNIASQTETIRKSSSASKNDDKPPCVCPTGECPKIKAKPPCDEGTSKKVWTSTNQALGRGYKSTADAILAPAIKVLPSTECAISPLSDSPKTNDMKSESSFACCMCGKPVTPVASKKTTSIPKPTKSFSKNKVISPSESSDDDFLCCSCRANGSPSVRPRNFLLSKSSEKSIESSRVSKRKKPASGAVKTSCSREVCCSCDNQETHILTKTLTTEIELSKSKIKPDTKDVYCLAKISRDKASKTGAHRRKDKDSIKTTTPIVSNNSSGHVSLSSTTREGCRISDSSDSNVCCSSIEQVMAMTKKKGKGRKCACDGQESKGNKEECVCEKDTEPKEPKQGKQIEPSPSCFCPPKLFEKY